MKKKIVRLVIPIVAVIVLVVLALVRIQDSVWFDESYTAYLIRGDFSEIWSLTAVDVHPPFYYFLLKVWSIMFGTSDVALRMMSVLFAAIAIILIFCLVKKLFGLKAANIATILTALSPILVRYAEEVRMYTLVLTIVLAASLVLVYALESGKKKLWAFYGVLVALGMWTHYFVALAWIAHLIFMAVYYKKDMFKHWRELMLGYGVAVVLFLPWISNFFAQVSDVAGGFWVPEVTLATVVNYVTTSFVFAETGEIKGWLVILMLGLGVVLIMLARGAKEKKVGDLLLGLLIIVPPILLVLLSLPPRTPLFVDRYVIYSAVLIWTWLGVKIAQQKQWWVIGVALVVAVVGIVNVLGRAEKSDIKSLVTQITERDQESVVKITTLTEAIYYDAVVYETERAKVFGVDELYSYPWGSYRPIQQYRYNLAERLEDITGPKWLILDKDATIKWNYTDIVETDDHKAIKVL